MIKSLKDQYAIGYYLRRPRPSNKMSARLAYVGRENAVAIPADRSLKFDPRIKITFSEYLNGAWLLDYLFEAVKIRKALNKVVKEDLEIFTIRIEKEPNNIGGGP